MRFVVGRVMVDCRGMKTTKHHWRAVNRGHVGKQKMLLRHATREPQHLVVDGFRAGRVHRCPVDGVARHTRVVVCGSMCGVN